MPTSFVSTDCESENGRRGNPRRFTSAGNCSSRELVVTGSDAAEVLQAATSVLDEVAAAVSLFVVANGSLRVAASRNDGNGTCLPEGTAQAVGIVAFVTGQVSHATGTFEEGGGSLDVADVTGVSISA